MNLAAAQPAVGIRRVPERSGRAQSAGIRVRGCVLVRWDGLVCMNALRLLPSWHSAGDGRMGMAWTAIRSRCPVPVTSVQFDGTAAHLGRVAGPQQPPARASAAAPEDEARRPKGFP